MSMFDRIEEEYEQRIAALEAENERLKVDLHEWEESDAAAPVLKMVMEKPFDPQLLPEPSVVIERDMLRAENAAIREDKARLDYLEEHLNSLSTSGYGADDRWFEMLYCDGNKVEGATVRTCIDDARKGAPGDEAEGG